MRSNQQHCPTDSQEQQDISNQLDSIGDSGIGDKSIEPQTVTAVTSSNGLGTREEIKSAEPKELNNKLHEFDEDVRKAVSNIFNDTVKSQAEDQHDLSDDGEQSVIDVELEDNENDENTLNTNLDATFNDQSNESQLIRSEVVTQRTQHLMIQAVDGGIFQMGIREEVVTTTTVTESRSETNEPDPPVTPIKREVRDSRQTKPPLKRKLSIEETVEADSKSKRPLKRRCSVGDRGFRSGRFHCA